MTDTRRTAYNKLHYDAIRQQREAIKAFKEANPERFAELLKKVEEDVATPSPFTLLTPTPHFSSSRVKEILAEIGKGRKDYFIYVEVVHDGWTEEHKYFEMLYNPTDVDEVIEKLKVRWNITLEPENIKRVEKCSCPACV